MRYTTWVERALDESYWRSHRVQTDISFAAEQGFAFVGSSRWTVGADSEDYIQVSIPSDTVVRFYDRLIAVTGGVWEIDIVQVSDITDGTTPFIVSPLNTTAQRAPKVGLIRGATNPTVTAVREEVLIPAARGPNISGVTSGELVYRVINGQGSDQLALRVANTDNSRSHTINIKWLWSEEYPLDD